MMANTPPTASQNRFSSLLLEGLDHYRKGKMMEAVRAWEEAYLLEPTNLRAREFLRSALERIHAHMGGAGPPVTDLPALQTPFGGMPKVPPQQAGKAAASQPGPGKSGHPWLPARPPDPQGRRPSAPGERQDEAAAPERRTSSSAGVARRSSDPGGVQRRSSDPGRAGQGERRQLPPRSPWDDGPSIAIPGEERPSGDQNSGVWGIHDEAIPSAPDNDETDVWIRGAKELVALNDFSGALELTNKILARRPNDADAQQMHHICEENLIQMFESRLGSMDRRPRVAIKPDEVIWLNLDPRAGFVLAQIDGEVSFEDLYAICGLSRLDTARILSQLLEEGVIAAEAPMMAARGTR
jgi:hypothetical protein